MEQGLTRNQVISVLTKSPHGDLKEYLTIGVPAAQQDPDFFSHLIAWNVKRGQVRDAKTALPIIALTSKHIRSDDEMRENAQALVLTLDPRNMVKAVRYSMKLPVSHAGMKTLIEKYLRDREAATPRFDRLALQHRHSLHELYALLRIKPGVHAERVLGFYKDKAKKERWPKTGIFAQVARLGDMSAQEAASVIVKHRIPFLVAQGALGKKAKDPEVVQALIEAMSPTELVTNAKLLEKLGVKSNPALRATFEAALSKASTSKKTTLKTTRAAQAVGGVIGEKLKGLQEKQLDNMSVEGDWLVLADKSGSMSTAIEKAREIAALLARVGKGSVHLVFFDTMPTYHNVTGKTLEDITKLTKNVRADGGTSIGCGLAYVRNKKLNIDGIAVISDGGENSIPWFAPEYAAYCKQQDKEVPIYFYRVEAGDGDAFSEHLKQAGIDFHIFDLDKRKTDYYSLPDLVATMRTNKYDLTEEIMQTPLLKLADVLRVERSEETEVAL